MTRFDARALLAGACAGSALATGCVTVVKPSEYTPLTTLKLAQIFSEAGLPPGVFNIVLGLGQSAGKMLAEHPDINKLVLTGGTEAGRIAGRRAVVGCAVGRVLRRLRVAEPERGVEPLGDAPGRQR